MPSRRKRSSQPNKPNLIPIMDGVFTFIFFLLMSINFIKIFEIHSDIPMVSNREPPPNKKELALTLKIYPDTINVYTGVPSSLLKKIPKVSTGEYDHEMLRETLINIKSRNVNEKTVILDPEADLDYEEIVKIMDTVKIIRPTDEAFYETDKDGIQHKVQELFGNIIFGDIQS